MQPFLPGLTMPPRPTETRDARVALARYRYLPVSAISNSMRDAMLARRLVTVERLRERGIR
ncbi:hypothetical protein [Nioella sp.]|uniref:hypothetical protein n=1 Tax=Nioella sp. TaxID=1912091 RepID=UPI003A844D1B